jgi:tRNA A37 methylthiotransferase MiaB
MTASAAPKVGFVSLGCPKALVDSERILTQLRLDGYTISPSYEDADVVVVNTCGFIDSAREESLDAIGEALAENGKVIVTGCLGAEAAQIHERHPGVLAVTGPHQYEAVVGAVHAHETCDRAAQTRGNMRTAYVGAYAVLPRTPWAGVMTRSQTGRGRTGAPDFRKEGAKTHT